MGKFLDFYKISSPSPCKVPQDKVQGRYRNLRMQTFLAATFGYALYYVCRTSLNVMKQPIIDSGFLTACQLGPRGSCWYWTYAVGKFVNGFLADHCNIKKFMATGLVISAAANFIMGILGVSCGAAGASGMAMLICFAIMWGINGWSQSMGAPPAIISLSRWFPLDVRGTWYGFFSASHNFGEGLSFIFVSLMVSLAGWQWGFFSAALAGVLGVVLIIFCLHDTPQSKGLPSIEVLAGEEVSALSSEKSGVFPESSEVPLESSDVLSDHSDDSSALSGISSQHYVQDTEPAAGSGRNDDAGRIQKAVLRNPGVWILALSSAFMYMSRYAINEWGMFFLQKVKGFGLKEAAFIIAVNTVMGIIGTVVSGYMSDRIFKGDRKLPALFAGILETLALVLFLYGGDGWLVNVLSMTLFGISIGVLISFLGGLMAVDLVPREATGAAIGIVGLASYIAAGLMNVISGWLIDGQVLTDAATGEVLSYEFKYVSIFWTGSAVISFLLPILNWHRRPAAM